MSNTVIWSLQLKAISVKIYKIVLVIVHAGICVAYCWVPNQYSQFPIPLPLYSPANIDASNWEWDKSTFLGKVLKNEIIIDELDSYPWSKIQWMQNKIYYYMAKTAQGNGVYNKLNAYKGHSEIQFQFVFLHCVLA